LYKFNREIPEKQRLSHFLFCFIKPPCPKAVFDMEFINIQKLADQAPINQDVALAPKTYKKVYKMKQK
jgi:hypothetical protein